MKMITAFGLVLVCLVTQGADLPRSTPEAQGISSRAVLGFVEAVDSKVDSMHSFMLLRHGQVIAEGWWAPYDAATPHVMWSLSKSFTSTAVGIAIGEGKLNLDDEVLKFFPDDGPPEPSANLKLMRVSDLLRMSTGNQTEAKRTPETPWLKTFLAQPVVFKPGTHFLYNSMGTYTLSAMVQKATGSTVLDYLTPRLFEPLSIERPEWETSPQGISCGGWGLHLRTEDIAKFGQLYLQKGRWNGKQLVPEAWVDAATARQTSNGSNPKSDWDQGYGYQFWRCRHNAYRGDGAFGQYCVVMPDQDAVLIITSGVKNMQNPLDIVWDTLLPAFKAASLDADDAMVAALRLKTKELALKSQGGSATPSPVASQKFVFPANERKLESIVLEGGGEAATTVVMHVDGVDQRIVCGKNAWIKGRASWGLLKNAPMFASGGWTDSDTFKAKLCFNETAFMVTLVLKFSEKEVEYSTEANVNFGSTKEPTLIGKLQ